MLNVHKHSAGGGTPLGLKNVLQLWKSNLLGNKEGCSVGNRGEQGAAVNIIF